MRVWQAHKIDERLSRDQIDDWSWGRTLRRVNVLVQLARPYRWRVLGGTVALLVATAASLAPPILAKVAIDRGIGDQDLWVLGVVVAAFVLAGLVGWGAGLAQTYLTSWVGERVLADLRLRLFRHLGRLSLGFYERNRTGAIISRMTNDVEALDQLVTEGVTSLVQNTLVLVGSSLIGAHLVSRLEESLGHLVSLAGGLITVSGLILGFGAMAMLVFENVYVLIKDDGVLLHENGKETSIAWGDLDGVRVDSQAPGFLVFERRAATSFRWFHGKSAKAVCARVEEAKRKAMHGLLRSEE